MKVKDIMSSTSLKFCKPETNIFDVERLMNINNLESLPVLDVAGKAIGLITRHDIKIATSKALSPSSKSLDVEKIMIINIHTINSSDNISSALSNMISNGIGKALVIDKNGKLEGVVTLLKLMSCNNNRMKERVKRRANHRVKERESKV